MVKQRSCEGMVIQAQDYSIHDGSGVRTTVFLAGCGLRCQWCANPESWTKEKKLAFYQHKCRDCGDCVAACNKGIDPRLVVADPNCDQCGACVAACTHNALQIACEMLSADALMCKLKRDELFFRYTGGGVTFSGGEPFLQHEYMREIMDRCDLLGIGYVVETCGLFSWSQAQDLVARCEHIFFDIKHMDSEKHQLYTGVGNDKILQNAIAIFKLGISMTIRVPFIPQVNGDENNIKATAQFMHENLPGVAVELLPYHELGQAKYKAIKMESHFHSFTIPTESELNYAYSIFNSFGVAKGD